MRRPRRHHPARRSDHRGFALIAVIAVVAVVTVISMELVRSIGLEARGATARLQALQLERMALGGHEVARYLEQRGLLAPEASLDGLPVDAVSPGVYQVRFPEGVAEIRFGAENGKVSLTNAPAPILTAVFTRWAGNRAEGQRLAEAVVDWRDPDPFTAEGNAESSDYPDAGFGPRNRGFGAGDAHLVFGFGEEDFLPAVLEEIRGAGEGWILPQGLYSLASVLGSDGRINPNFAPVPILESVPFLNEAAVARVVQLREERFFTDISDFERRVGIGPGPDREIWMTFAPNSGRTVSVSAENGAGMRQERHRVYESAISLNALTGQVEPRLFLRNDFRFDPGVHGQTPP